MATQTPDLALKVTKVPLTKLKPYPTNPRKGNVTIIKESLRQNGQFRAIIVQKSTMYVLDGNHTFMAMKQLKWKTADCIIIDVDDEAAARIVIAANRTSDVGEIDQVILAELMKTLPDAAGTGYSDTEMAAVMQAVDQAIADSSLAVPIAEAVANAAAMADGDGFDNAADGLGATGDEEDELGQRIETGQGPLEGESQEDYEARMANSFEDVDDEQAGIFELKDNIVFPSKHPLGIPPLRPEMLLQDIDEIMPLHVWASQASRTLPQGDDWWWWYNYGIENTRGMKHMDRMVMAFYTYDKYFDCWYDDPARYVGKMINLGIKYAMMPDYSEWADDPLVLNLHSTYRSRWVARYMQEVGVKVIPNLSWPYGDRAEEYISKYSTYGLPDEIPVASTQLRTGMNEILADPKAKKDLLDELNMAFTAFNPQTLIVYAGPGGQQVMDELKPKFRVVMLPDRNSIIRDWQKARKEQDAKTRTQQPTKKVVIKRAKKS